jgi:hypothetical protein
MTPTPKLRKTCSLAALTAGVVFAAALGLGQLSVLNAQQADENSAQPATNELLSQSDINKIRLWELTFPDSNPLQGTILDREQTLREFWDTVILKNPQYQDMNLTERDYEMFVSLNNFENQVRLMLDYGNADFWNKIQITSDPQVLIDFRSTIQPFVLQSCATAGCHRDQSFHGFKLFGGGEPNTAQTYTNFYILSTYTYGGQHLIDRDNPRNSLIIQYLLSPEVAMDTHPGKIGPQTTDFDQNQIVGWIDSLRFPMQDYGINYSMPQEQPASGGQ